MNNNNDDKTQFTPREKISFGIVDMMYQTYFHNVIARMFTLTESTMIPTIGVRMIGLNKIELLYNADFVRKLSKAQLRVVLEHEASHVALGHLNAMPKEPALNRAYNIAQDLAINSNLDKGIVMEIPGLYPGEGRFQGLEVNKSSAYYLSHILKSGDSNNTNNSGDSNNTNNSGDSNNSNNAGNSGDSNNSNNTNNSGDSNNSNNAGNSGDSGDGNFDVHLTGVDENGETVDGLSEAQRKALGSLVGEAAAQADAASSNGWGNLSAGYINEVRAFAKGRFNWRYALRNVINKRQHSKYQSTYSRPSRRFPGLPGKKRSRTCKVLVAVDESGSVSEDLWTAFMEALSSLSKHASFDILPFDSEIHLEGKVTFNCGDSFAISRKLRGGTDFTPPTSYFNDNLSDYDILFMVTDGHAPEPIEAVGKRVWVIPFDENLSWAKKDEVVKVRC